MPSGESLPAKGRVLLIPRMSQSLASELGPFRPFLIFVTFNFKVTVLKSAVQRKRVRLVQPAKHARLVLLRRLPLQLAQPVKPSARDRGPKYAIAFLQN